MIVVTGNNVILLMIMHAVIGLVLQRVTVSKK